MRFMSALTRMGYKTLIEAHWLPREVALYMRQQTYSPQTGGLSPSMAWTDLEIIVNISYCSSLCLPDIA